MKSLGIEKIPTQVLLQNTKPSQYIAREEIADEQQGCEIFPNQGLSDYNNGATERRFSPYSDNGGSVVAIAGEDFCVIASDTRLYQNVKWILAQNA